MQAFVGETSPFTHQPYEGFTQTPGSHGHEGWTHEKHVEAGRKAAAALSHEERQERARRGVETKRQRGNLGSGGDAEQGDFAPPRGEETRPDQDVVELDEGEEANIDTA
eukprot:tig00020934_g16101.t1